MPKLNKEERLTAQIAAEKITAAKVSALSEALTGISQERFLDELFARYSIDEVFGAMLGANIISKESIVRKLVNLGGVTFSEDKLLSVIRDLIQGKIDTFQNIFKPILSAEEAAVLANMSERNLRRYTKPDCYDAPSKHQEFQKACNEVGHRGGVSALPRKKSQQPKLYSRDEVLRWLFGLESTDALPELKEENLLLIVQFLSDLMMKATGGKNGH